MSLPFARQFEADPAALRAVRQQLQAALAGVLAIEDAADNAVLVFDELASNAIEHGAAYRSSARPLGVRLSAEGADLVFEFEDRDMPRREVAALRQAFAAGVPELPDLEDERGRGLFLITMTMDQIAVHGAAGDGAGMRLVGRFSGVLGGG